MIAAMCSAPLIRRQVTAYRGVKAVTTHEVLECIREMSSETFSTREVSDAVRDRFAKFSTIDGPRLEYSVRQAVSWLVKRGHIAATKETVRRITRAGEPYDAALYRFVERGGPCDVAMLNQIFFGFLEKSS